MNDNRQDVVDSHNYKVGNERQVDVVVNVQL